ncbi:MAG: radical SAM protein [Candidatus Omnitrophica bacterium]|nr:radical SAM protein [Candidatus Omnitrophota bacterium]MDD5078710.1 radical SAM protein [Candidatus Omnitrophota bacterium]MDD5080251.1 radical SAM protein [Candidatus Omnitrophota bacterium]
MRKVEYRDFSLKTHQGNLRRRKPSVCQFELTFKCDFRCRYCYISCYNKRNYLNRELSTRDIEHILDKVHKSGVLWLCFTGGDPLTRPDFPQIYLYAKRKGFLITVFTNGLRLNKKILGLFARFPPFMLELTLNAVSKRVYEKIAGKTGSFEKVRDNIVLMHKMGIPFRIKTQMTRDNHKELPRVKKFVEGLGLDFLPGYTLFPRLDGDLFPCDLRLAPRELVRMNKEWTGVSEECILVNPAKGKQLFNCSVVSGDSYHIDPEGRMFLCSLLRDPRYGLKSAGVMENLGKLLKYARHKEFQTASRCRGCRLRYNCLSCPGRAYLEKGDMETPVEYYCELAHVENADQGR